MYCYGYWTRDSAEPLAYASDPAVIDGDGPDPISLISEQSGISGLGIESGQGGIASSGTGRFVVANGNGPTAYLIGPHVAVEAGDPVGASALVTGDVTVAVTWYDASGVYVGGSQDAPDGGSGWRRVHHLTTAPAGAAYAKAIIRSRVAQWFGFDLLTVGVLSAQGPLRPGLPAPTLPQPGDDLTVEWAEAVIAQGARGWRYVPVPRAYSTSPQVAGSAAPTGYTAVELTTLPVNDPRVVAASVDVLIRADSTADGWASVYDYDNTGAGSAHLNGVSGRYAGSGPYIVMVGGVNNRQVKYRGNAATTLVWLSVVGYWIAED
jgi:hypothetical protein